MIYTLLLGIIVLNLLRLNEGFKKPDFTWKYFFKVNGIPALVIFITGLVVIYFAADAETYISKILPGIGFKVGGFTMFMFGITGDVILKKLIAMFNPEKETAIGINK